MDYEDIPIRPMSGEEAREWINKFGGREEYIKKMREAHDEPRQTPPVEPIWPSAEEVVWEYYVDVAKARGLSGSLELFEKDHAAYREHNEHLCI